jgi:hypothetical protein
LPGEGTQDLFWGKTVEAACFFLNGSPEPPELSKPLAAIPYSPKTLCALVKIPV